MMSCCCCQDAVEALLVVLQNARSDECRANCVAALCNLSACSVMLLGRPEETAVLTSAVSVARYVNLHRGTRVVLTHNTPLPPILAA